MKAKVKTLLDRLGLREWIWDSLFYFVWLRLANRPAYENMRSQVSFYRGIRDNFGMNCDLWFDVGANVGNKTAIFQHFCSKVIAVEPDPINFSILQRRFRIRRGVTLVQAAVGKMSGRDSLTRPLGSDGAISTLSPKQLKCLVQNTRFEMTERAISGHQYEVVVVTLDQLILKHGMPSYIKVDVEGYEREVFGGLTRTVAWMSFEANLPDFEDETIACLEHYNSLVKQARFNYVVAEPPTFVGDRWISVEEISSVVRSKRYLYMEIHCRQS